MVHKNKYTATWYLTVFVGIVANLLEHSAYNMDSMGLSLHWHGQCAESKLSKLNEFFTQLLSAIGMWLWSLEGGQRLVQWYCIKCTSETYYNVVILL